MSTEEDFQAVFQKVNKMKKPETSAELVAYLTAISEALDTCEKLLMYLSTAPSRSDDLLTYLFDYRQLMNLEIEMKQLHLSGSLEAKPATIQPKTKKKWWPL